ncbi:hypothetical protein WJX77_003993 [Trebouxia sp. C0004]
MNDGQVYCSVDLHTALAAKAATATAFYKLERSVLRLLGQIQISGQPGVPAIVEIERPPIHAPYKLSSPVVTTMASIVGIMQFLQDASLEFR